jgi:hypothetical protein
MANQTRLDSGLGHIAKPNRIVLDAEGRATGGAVLSLNETIRRIIDAINGRLSLGDGSHGTNAGNVDAQYLEFTTPSTPDSEFEVYHGLNRIPAGYVACRRDKAAHLYDSNPGSWSPTVAYFKANVATVLFRIIIW